MHDGGAIFDMVVTLWRRWTRWKMIGGRRGVDLVLNGCCTFTHGGRHQWLTVVDCGGGGGSMKMEARVSCVR